MARKGASAQRSMSEGLFREDLAERRKSRNTQEKARADLMPEAERLLQSEGYSEREKRAIGTGATRPIGTVYDVARSRTERRHARTRGRAGYQDVLGELTRQEGREKSTAASNVEAGFADEKFRRRITGLQTLMELYGIDTNLLQSYMRAPHAALQAHAGGIEPGLMETVFGPFISGGAQVGAAFAGK